MYEGFEKQDIGLDHPVTIIMFAVLIASMVFAFYLMRQYKKDEKKK